MEYQVNPIKSSQVNDYYIQVIEFLDNQIYTSDTCISEILGLNCEDYIDMMIEKFNAVNTYCGIWFNKEEDIKSACEWIESILVMKRLVNK